MYAAARKSTTIAAALAVCLAVASTAQAGGYAGNACVGKKQAAVGKYARAVTKAWVKYPDSVTERDEAIAKAKTKLDSTWTNEEAKAVSKNASCNESTSTSTAAATAVNDAVTPVSTDSTLPALGDYMAKAMKAHGKYIKDPVKDPGKTNLNAVLAEISTDELTGASLAVTSAAAALKVDLVAKTTTAPDYADTFQTIVPGDTVNYKKEVLSPTCADDTPYMYFAKRGTSNNVLMYYQGGGACWDLASCFSIPGGTCSRTAEADDNPALSSTGFANYNDPGNPFYDWSVVFVTYCTCDVHWGDSQVNYAATPPAKIVQHRGRVNASVAEKFAREHFIDPDRVFVTGSSAGSYGAIMNSYWLMNEVWPNADFSVMGDAGVGVITQQFLTNSISNWGLETHFPADLPNVEMPVSNLSLVELIDGLAQKFPDARFANYDSSYDGGGGSQTQFFQVMRHPLPQGSFIEDWSSFWLVSCEWNACMKEFKAENYARASQPGRPDNYKYFTGAGSRHTIFGSDKVFTETKSRTDTGIGVTFAQWVTAMIGNTGDWVNVDCNNPGGDCNLTNSCQGGTNAGGLCSEKCVGGDNDTLDCANDTDCPGGGVCTNTHADCPGGTCQLDPDTTNAPYNDDDTITCAPTTCPCGPSNAKCYDGANEGLACATDADCPSGTCSWVKCPTFTP